MTERLKKCAICAELFALSEFSRACRKSGVRAGEVSYASYCRACSAAYSKKVREKQLAPDGTVSIKVIATKQASRCKYGRNGTAWHGESDITAAYLEQLWEAQQGCCAVSGLLLSRKREPLSPFTASLDRIDNSKGYLMGNVRWVVYGVNALKGTGSDSDLIKIAQSIVTKSRT